MKLSHRFNFKLFGNLQSTQYTTKESKTDDPDFEEVEGISTPETVMGVIMDYRITKKFSASSTLYTMDEQTYLSPSLWQDDAGHVIPEIVDLNIKLTYKFNKNYMVFLNLKNIDGKHKEYGFADNVYKTTELGVNYKF